MHRKKLLVALLVLGVITLGYFLLKPKTVVIKLSEIESPNYSYMQECDKAAASFAPKACTGEIRNYEELQSGSRADCVVTCR